MIPDIPSVIPIDVTSCAPDNDHTVHAIDLLQGFVYIALEGDCFASAHAFICGNNQSAGGVADAIFQCFRRESAEYHGVNGADAGAGEHGKGGLGHHRHVDTDAVAFAYAAGSQGIGEAIHVQ